MGPFSDDPRRRRWWLLTKALEIAPLRDALEIACAADVFLTGGTGAPASVHATTARGGAASRDWAGLPDVDEALTTAAAESAYFH
jgi:hypothetical protein